jgi:hypothetical protein
MACSAASGLGGMSGFRFSRHTGAEEVAALAEVADGRIDLLAVGAALAIGFNDQDADAPVYLQIAQQRIKASADTAVILRWVEEGRRRAGAARRPPFTR